MVWFGLVWTLQMILMFSQVQPWKLLLRLGLRLIANCKAISGKNNIKKKNMRMSRKVLWLGRASMLDQGQWVTLRDQIRSVVPKVLGSFHPRGKKTKNSFLFLLEPPFRLRDTSIIHPGYSYLYLQSEIFEGQKKSQFLYSRITFIFSSPPWVMEILGILCG